MDYYFAGAEGKDLTERLIAAGAKKALMVAAGNFKADYTHVLENFDKVFIDSGAFSAYTRKIKINLYEYIDFLKKYLHYKSLAIYASLDVIGDEVKTMENTLIMEKEGLNPLWVFHTKDSWKLLEQRLEARKYIAVGGLSGARLSKDDQKRFFDRVFFLASKYWPVKIHGFGISTSKVLMAYPFYSCDSTSWLSGSKFYTCNFYDEIKGFDNVKLFKKSEILKKKIPVHKLADSQTEKKYRERCHFDIGQFMKFEKHITQIWEKRGVKFD